MLARVLAAVLFTVPSPTPVEAAREASTGSTKIEVLLVDASALPLETLRPELALRVRDAAVLDFATAELPAPKKRWAYLAVIDDGADRIAIEIVLPDGRGYRRAVTTDDVSAARAVASAVSHLVAAIEADTAAPDRRDAIVPARVAAPKPTAAPAPARLEPSATPARPRASRGSVDVLARAGALVGLAAPSASERWAGGGSLGVELRGVRGALGLVDVRGAASRSGDATLGRVRVALGGGWQLQRGAFVLTTALAFTVEPWWLRRGGERTDLYGSTGSRRTPTPLLGLAAVLAPGAAIALPRRRTALRVGARLELAGSGSFAGGSFGVPRLVQSPLDPRPRLRAGGLELALGIEIGMRFGARLR